MGTRSKMGVNSRCTVRGWASPGTIADCLTTLHHPTAFNNAARREAKSTLRRHARRIKRRVARKDRNPVQRQLVEIGERL